MRKKHLCFAILSIGVMSFLLSSCVDNDYDLNKDIDLTIQVGGDLSLPGCNTEEITLKKIFDLDEGSIIKANSKGYYALYKEGDPIDPSKTDPIKDVTVDAPTVDDINTTLNFVQAPDMPGIIEATIDENDESARSSFTLEYKNMPKELLTLNSVTASMDINIHFSTIGMSSFANAYYLQKGFSLIFPSYLKIINTQTNEVLTNNRYVFVGDTRIGATETYTLPNLKVIWVDLSGFDNETEGLLPPLPGNEGKHLLVNGVVRIEGKAYIDWNNDKVPGIELGTEKTANLLAQVTMYDMPIQEVEGTVNPTIEPINSKDPLTFDDIPDFLADDEVVIDMRNPMINLEIKNEAPVPVFLNGVFRSRRGNNLTSVGIGNNNETGIQTVPIVIKAGGGEGHPVVTRLCLCRDVNNATEGYEAIEVANINDLIAKIPDDITFTIEPQADTEAVCQITLGQSYKVETSYYIDAPLAFGENLDIVYKDTINDWNSDIADNGIEIQQVNVVMDAINKIPLNLELSAEPIDTVYNVIEGIKVEVMGNIKPGDGLLGSETGEVKTEVTVKLTTEIEGSMQRLDGLLLRVNATNKDYPASQGVQLNEEQTLKLDNIRIKIPGGIKANFN